MSRKVETCRIEGPTIVNRKNPILRVELAEILAPPISIEAENILIEPNLTPSERRYTLASDCYPMDIQLSHLITDGCTPLYCK